MSTVDQNQEEDDGLTPEERAAMQITDEEIGNEATTTAAGSDDGADTGAADDPNAVDPAGPAAAAPANDGAAAPAAAAAEQEAAPQPQVQQSAPVLVVPVPEDVEARLGAVAAQKEKLAEDFDNGDITAKEYQQQLDVANKAERAIEREVDEAQLAAKMENQRQQNEWGATVGAFIAENKVYDPAANPRMHRALDQEVRDVATLPEFQGRTDAAAGREILARAHKNLTEAFGLKAPEAAAPPKPGQPVVPKPALPPTIGKLPAAEISDTGGKFAHLDRLQSNPDAYEAALAKLSEAELNAYLAA
jgi:hypothetical protein